jgi:hypothetical protein
VTTSPGVRARITWLLRGSRWRRLHVHRCLECGRTFCDDEPGSWTRHRDSEFPELCSPYSCKIHRDGSHHHVVPPCRSAGPFCPECAVRVADELIQLREAYRD